MPRGELSSGRHAKRHPLDWYVEEHWVTFRLADALGRFEREKTEGLALWDPCCGFGNTMTNPPFQGVEVYLSDLVDNVDPQNFENVYPDDFPNYRKPMFFSADFLDQTAAPAPCTIVCNPPYSYRKGIAEAFARHALKLATGRVCVLVPNKWLSSQGRYRLFMVDHPPAAVLHLTERPSMPPGDMIAAMGKRAFNGGMIDYCWVVWDIQNPTAPGMTRTIWLPHMSQPVAPIEGLA